MSVHMTARERVLLQALLANEQGLTLQELADVASVSVRTIQRDLPSLAKVAANHQLSLHRGHFLVLEGASTYKLALKEKLQTINAGDFTSDERVGLLLALLLDANEPVKLFALAKELNVTPATVGSDLTKAAEWLEQFGIKLIRKRGYGIAVKGTETNIRQAMSAILSENLTEEAFYEAVYSGQMQNEVASRLLHFVDLETIRLVQSTIQRVKEKHFDDMADQSFIALVVHATLAIERIKQGEQIRMDAGQLEALHQEDSLPVAQELAEALAQTFQITIPEAEIGYLVMHLRGARIGHIQGEPFEQSNAELAGRLKQFIAGMEQDLSVSLAEPSLFQGLLAHLKPALYRVRQGMKIHNPLLEKVKADYAALFAVTAKQASEAFAPLKLPEEEIGFLTLHFGAALERRKRSVSLSALVVCSSGIGSAKMLASRIRQEFPEISSITNASLFDLDKYDPANFDLFISTVKVETNNRQALRVSPMLTADEASLIKANIDELLNEQTITAAPPIRTNVEEKRSFVDIKRMASFIDSFLQSVRLVAVDELLAGIRTCCEILEERGALSEAKQVYEALLARERLGGIGIPGTGLALFHTRLNEIKRPVFVFLDLKTEAQVASMADGNESIKRAILMLAPEPLAEQELAFMSFVSILLIGSDDETALFYQGREHEITQFLEQKCREFMISYINEGVDQS
ncbi:hypothetical protein CHH74_11250 [Shouchella clausii]|nr:hypothetical protein CHH74_11250 [Shouchella clausii]